MRTKLLRTFLVLAATLLLAACGGTAGSTWTVAPLAPTPTTPPATPAPTGAPGSPDATAGTARTVHIELTGSLSFVQDGERLTSLEVTEGETIHFVLDNTAGFSHDFLIGTADQLSQRLIDGLPGVPEWTSGVEEFEYQVTAETAGLQFACTVPGHYGPMHGDFVVTR
ncbi:MAG: hypothetical protein KF809_17625 [Chloroflexi bacterium]|nr:hypothetical protein [Chloroflexota bacterium]